MVLLHPDDEAFTYVFSDAGVQGGALAHVAADVLVLLDEALRCVAQLTGVSIERNIRQRTN